MTPPKFETICIHHAEDRPAQKGAVAPPIYQASTFAYPDAESFVARAPGEDGTFDYTRTGNPTTEVLERKLALLEGGDQARAFGSGMAAISAAVLSCVQAGDHIVCVDTVYGPTRKLLTEFLPRFGVTTDFVGGTRVEDFESASRPETKLYYLESPSSLVFAIQDLEAVASLATSRGIATVCDNSYATPLFQRPLERGIDLVVHTATKYIGGHSDLVAGLVIGAKERMNALNQVEGQLVGGVCDPFASWLMLRGLRTLAIRLERHQTAALEIAQWLQSHESVAEVLHPGLPSHPGYQAAQRQMSGTNGLISIVLKDHSREATFRVIDALHYFCIAVSWGGYESLALPIRVRQPGETAARWGIRLSIGLEHIDDLRQDLDQALLTR